MATLSLPKNRYHNEDGMSASLSMSLQMWDKTVDAGRDYNVPKSVNEARMAFESLAQGNSRYGQANGFKSTVNSGSYSRLAKAQIQASASNATIAHLQAQSNSNFNYERVCGHFFFFFQLAKKVSNQI